MDYSAHSKRILYIVAGFFVLVGFALTIASVAGGDRLGTFLGFLIISGALVSALILRTITHLIRQVDVLARAVEELRHAVLSGEASLHEQIREIKDAAAVRMIDLSTFGLGDPSVLSAAMLDRDAYPRLVTTMEESPPSAASADRPHVRRPRFPAPPLKKQSSTFFSISRLTRKKNASFAGDWMPETEDPVRHRPASVSISATEVISMKTGTVKRGSLVVGGVTMAVLIATGVFAQIQRSGAPEREADHKERERSIAAPEAVQRPSLNELAISVSDDGRMEIAGVKRFEYTDGGQMVVEVRERGDWQTDPVLALNVPIEVTDDGDVVITGIRAIGQVRGHTRLVLATQQLGGVAAASGCVMKWKIGGDPFCEDQGCPILDPFCGWAVDPDDNTNLICDCQDAAE